MYVIFLLISIFFTGPMNPNSSSCSRASDLKHFPIGVQLQQDVYLTKNNWCLTMTNGRNVFKLGTA